MTVTNASASGDQTGFPDLTEPVSTHFPYQTDKPADDTFEIGLVLGGTVSAAAYTAGVLDFLVEALDAWTAAKERGEAVPRHNVIIRIVAGTSGGGISAVMLARLLGHAFPAYSPSRTSDELKRNLFYDIWVNEADISDLLKTNDLDGDRPLESILCADKLDQIEALVAGYNQGLPLGSLGTPLVRNYVENPLPIVLTLTNLRGVPYLTDFRGTTKRGEYFVDHADHIRFLVDILGGNPPRERRPDEVRISEPARDGALSWGVLAHASRGTSAFPVGLPPQVISRDIQHYRYRYAIRDQGVGREPFWLRPAWPHMIPDGARRDAPYNFLAVDGGCLNNEPVEFARTWLAGILCHNDRQARSAHRAVVLVDPFADEPKEGPVQSGGLFQTAAGTLSALIANGRYATADLDLFVDAEVYSRFMISPVRKDEAGNTLNGGKAIACAGLGAFIGFMSRAFRHHDFLLGRHNCQQFLRSYFILDGENLLFAADGPQEAATGEPKFFPIIPLMPSVKDKLPTAPWPFGVFNPESVRPLVHRRIEKIAAKLDAGLLKPPWSWLLTTVGNTKLGSMGADRVIGIIKHELKQAKLGNYPDVR